MRDRRDRGFTAVELLVVIIVVGIAAAVTVPALLRGKRNDLLAKCQSNLRTLGESAFVDQTMGPPIKERGGGYWEAVARNTNLKTELLSCPLSPPSRYRGPATNPATLPPLAPFGADAVGSHGEGEGGNVLLKNGEVRAVREEDPHWKMAAERLTP